MPQPQYDPGNYIWLKDDNNEHFITAKVVFVHYDDVNDVTKYQVETGADTAYSWPTSINPFVHVVSEDEVYGDISASLP